MAELKKENTTGRNDGRKKLKLVERNVKGKAIPLKAWTGPEVSRRLRLPDFKTIGTRRCRVVSPTRRLPLPPGNIHGTHFN